MTSLPIRRLTLYKQGIGYFERSGRFTGSTLSLIVPRESTNDVLKSLQLEIKSGDSLYSIDYETPEDKQHVLDQLTIKLKDGYSLHDVLSSLRGYSVTCYANKQQVTGRIVGVELLVNQQSPMLVLQQQATLHTIPLMNIERLEFEDQRARDSLHFFLDVSQTEQTHTTLTLRFADGEHQLTLHYLAPSPTWRMSYRLSKNAAGSTHLQAWALIDNALDEDLEDVYITLISGRPISFEYELYETTLPHRPHVSDEPVDDSVPVQDRGFRDFVATISHELRTPMTAMRGYADLLVKGVVGELSAEQKEMLAQIVRGTTTMQERLNELLQAIHLRDDSSGRYFSASNAGPLGDLKVSSSYFAPVTLEHAEATQLTYPIDNPITVKRGQSATVPIVDVAVPCEVLCVYNGDKMANHPLLVWRITNTSGVVLEQGPATLTEQGQYRGEGLMRFTGVNEQRELAYALEYGVLISEQREHYTQHVWQVHFDQHTRQRVETALEHDNIYIIDNRLNRDIDLLIERRRLPPVTYVDASPPLEIFATHERWRVSVAAQTQSRFVLRERTIRPEHTDLKTYTAAAFATVRESGVLSPQQETFLIRLIELHTSYHHTEAQLQAYQQEYEQLLEHQEQLRKNLRTLGTSEREGDLRNRVVDDLEQSEARRRTIEQDVVHFHQQLQTYETERQQLYVQLAQTSDST